MKYLTVMMVSCAIAACGTSDKALRALGPSGVSVTTVGAAGAPAVNPLPPQVAGPQQVQPGGAGIGGTEVSLPDPFGAAGANTFTGAAGSPVITTTPISAAAGTGF